MRQLAVWWAASIIKAGHQFEFSADGSLLAAADQTRRSIFGPLRAKRLANRTLGRSVNCLEFVPDDSSSSPAVMTVGASLGQKTFAQEFVADLSIPVVRLALMLRDLDRGGMCDGRIHVWNVKTKAPLSGDFRHEQSVRSLSFSKDGQRS